MRVRNENMLQAALCAPLLIAASFSVQAADDAYRLAYSKAENVEVFVDHPANQPWCAGKLRLRFALGQGAKDDVVERFMPKIGGLLRTQCGQATTADWQSVNHTGKVIANGSASSAAGWIVVAAASTKVVTSASNPVVPENAAQAVPTSKDAGTSPVASAQSEGVATDETAAPPASENPAAASAAVAATPPAPSPRNSALAEFTVAGWKPLSEREAFANAGFFTEVKDARGCQFRLTFAKDVSTEGLRVESKDTTCGEDGFAAGSGEVKVTRSDGRQIKFIDASFYKGMPFINGSNNRPIVAFDKEGSAYIHLSSDAVSKVHYLMEVPYSGYSSVWEMAGTRLLAVTEDGELFRNIESINNVVLSNVPDVTRMVAGNRNINFLAVSDFDRGILKGDREVWLYETSIYQDWRSKRYEFNPNRSSNHMLAQEQQRAQLARLEAERKAREERFELERLAQQAEEELRLYRSYEELVKNPKEMLGNLVTDVNGQAGYRALMRGGRHDIRQIVRVASVSKEAASIDFPYEAESAYKGDEQIQKGWYFITGAVSLDPKRRDAQNLPMTRIESNTAVRCEQQGCADLRDPVKLTRLRLNAPDWTPDDARKRVQRAWPERYAQLAQ